MKILSLKLKLKKYWKLIFICLFSIFLLFSVILPAFQLLDAIHYDIDAYVDDIRHIWRSSLPLKENQEYFEIIVNHIYMFTDSYPNFFEEFDHDFLITDEGIQFYKANIEYPDNVYLYRIYDEKWSEAVDKYYQAFPKDWGPEEGYRVYPGYVVFDADRILVYTRDRKYPNELIDGMWNMTNFWKVPLAVVNVIKHARGWYEIHTSHYIKEPLSNK